MAPPFFSSINAGRTDTMERLIYFKEKRKYPRVYTDLPLDYWVQYDSDAHGGIVIDASEGGFLIYSTEDIPVGTNLRIAVLFPREYELANFEVFAEIIWKRVAEKWEEGYQYGIKFIQVLEEDYRKLKKLLITKLLST